MKSISMKVGGKKEVIRKNIKNRERYGKNHTIKSIEN